MLRELRLAIQAEPGAPIPQYNLASVLLEHGQPEESLATLERLFVHETRHDSSHVAFLDRALDLYFAVQQRLAHKRQVEVCSALDDLRRSRDTPGESS